MPSGPESEDAELVRQIAAPLGLGDGRPPTVADQQINFSKKLLKFTTSGWLIGLFYFVWFTGIGYAVLPWWAYAVLVVGGMVASFIIGWVVVVLVVGPLTYIVPGKPDGSLPAYVWMAVFISPVVAFFAARYALLLTASFLS